MRCCLKNLAEEGLILSSSQVAGRGLEFTRKQTRKRKISQEERYHGNTDGWAGKPARIHEVRTRFITSVFFQLLLCIRSRWSCFGYSVELNKNTENTHTNRLIHTTYFCILARTHKHKHKHTNTKTRPQICTSMRSYLCKHVNVYPHPHTTAQAVKKYQKKTGQSTLWFDVIHGEQFIFLSRRIVHPLLVHFR